MPSRRIVVPLKTGSDGDAGHVPNPGTKTLVNPPTLYLEKIGQQWIEERGEAVPGVEYVLERLPVGYTMWQRPRTSNPRHVDKYLYGHPQGRVFDSPNRYYPHFKFLMDNDGNNIGCTCTVCAGSGGVLPGRSPTNTAKRPSNKASSTASVSSRSSKASQVQRQLVSATKPAVLASSHYSTASTVRLPIINKGRPKMIGAGLDPSHVDEEGTPDVYRNLIDKLRRQNTIDDVIEEPLSPDWRAEAHNLPGFLRTLKNQEQWIPRVGDLVLYIRHLPKNVKLIRHDVNGEYGLYDEEAGNYLGTPLWEAGLVAEASTRPSTVANLQNDSDSSVIYSGVRVEPLPDPNGTDKSLSKRHKYLSIAQIRPLIFWKEFLHQIPQAEWHPTVINALTVMSTLSLVGKYRFRGTWPNASIYCHAMHLGPETLAVGDTVRLLPNTKSGQTDCEDVLLIRTIRLKWSNMDVASNNDYDEGRPYNSEVWLYGVAYTSNPLRMNKQDLSEDNIEPPNAAVGYGQWFPLHSTTKELAVPYSRIFGRLYEKEAMSFFLNLESSDIQTLDYGREGLLEGREFSRQRDQRIAQEDGATWYWGDSRANALDLRTLNGFETTQHDQTRDIRELRKSIKAAENIGNNRSGAGAKLTTSAPSLASFGGKGLRNFMAPGTTSMPHRTFGAKGPDVSNDASSSPNTSESSSSGKKRASIIDLSDGEDEDEIRQYTRVIEEDSPSPTKKKAKVVVVID